MLKAAKGKRYLVIDLEATCDRGKFQNEIIEIGCIMYEVGKGIVDVRDLFVKPQINPILTPFCVSLTSITQETVDSAEPFPQVLERLAEWFSDYEPFVFCSWGNYDRKQISKDCHLHGIAIPKALGTENHLNLKGVFPRLFPGKKCGVKAALRRLGLDFVGTHHRGIDDARNIARILEAMINRTEGEE